VAIGCIHTEWLFRLVQKGAFSGRRALLDLGPQDIQTSRLYLEEAIARHLGRDPAGAIAAISDGAAPRRDCQGDFYRLYGIEEYKSADLDDDRADYTVDFNHPAIEVPRFDVVTDFGTAEHVYDIARVFEFMHRALKPGGLALHCVPAFAFPNHGFYTPNPNLFVEFARANDYELVDFSYVDNMFVREKQIAENGIGGFSFDALPIQMEDMRDTGAFMTKTVLQFHRNLLSTETRNALGALAPHLPADTAFPSEQFNLCFVFDLVFVALQKPPRERPLVAPIQTMAGVAPLPQRGRVE